VLTSAVDDGEWSKPLPGHLAPGKEALYSLNRRLRGLLQSRRFGKGKCLLHLQEFKHRIVRSIISVKIKVTLEHTTKAHRGSRDIVALFL